MSQDPRDGSEARACAPHYRHRERSSCDVVAFNPVRSKVISIKVMSIEILNVAVSFKCWQLIAKATIALFLPAESHRVREI